MSTPWIIATIVFVLAIIASNILLLKKSAKFGLKKKAEDREEDDKS